MMMRNSRMMNGGTAENVMTMMGYPSAGSVINGSPTATSTPNYTNFGDFSPSNNNVHHQQNQHQVGLPGGLQNGMNAMSGYASMTGGGFALPPYQPPPPPLGHHHHHHPPNRQNGHPGAPRSSSVPSPPSRLTLPPSSALAGVLAVAGDHHSTPSPPASNRQMSPMSSNSGVSSSLQHMQQTQFSGGGGGGGPQSLPPGGNVVAGQGAQNTAPEHQHQWSVGSGTGGASSGAHQQNSVQNNQQVKKCEQVQAFLVEGRK
jgi:hypothetical protein